MTAYGEIEHSHSPPSLPPAILRLAALRATRALRTSTALLDVLNLLVRAVYRLIVRVDDRGCVVGGWAGGVACDFDETHLVSGEADLKAVKTWCWLCGVVCGLLRVATGLFLL